MKIEIKPLLGEHRYRWVKNGDGWTSIPEQIYIDIATCSETKLVSYLTDNRFTIRTLAERRVEQMRGELDVR